MNYLDEVGAEKVYATSPSFPAMSSDIESTLAFDTFALLWLEQKPPEDIVEDLIDEGVDYVVIDSWAWYWTGEYKKQVSDLVMELRNNSRLIRVIQPYSACRAEIYRLGAEAEGVFNGDFKQWVTERGMDIPLGWAPVLLRGENDEAGINQSYIDGEKCVKLTIYEDGYEDDRYDSTRAGIAQKIVFPEGKIKLQVLAEVNATPSGRQELLTGVHFVDESGRSLIVGFSDEVVGEEIYELEEGYRMLVIKEAQLHEWSDQFIDLAEYWSLAGWQQPEEVSILIMVSAHFNYPGDYTFYISDVEIEEY